MNFFIIKNKAFLSWENTDLTNGASDLRKKLQGILTEVIEAESCTLNWKQVDRITMQDLGVFLAFLSHLKLKGKTIQIILNPKLANGFRHFSINEYFGSFLVEEVENG